MCSVATRKDGSQRLYTTMKQTEDQNQHLQNYEFGEESKKKQEAIGKNSDIKQQRQGVSESHECKFVVATLLKRENKTAKANSPLLKKNVGFCRRVIDPIHKNAHLNAYSRIYLVWYCR